MQILALDTASPAPSVTLLTAGAVWEEPLSTSRGLIPEGGLIPLPQPSRGLIPEGGLIPPPQLPESRRASEELLPAIERCFTAAGTRLHDCDRIAVCSGPGSFTGLRIGLATAWGLGRATGVPVEMVSTLEALAETARPRSQVATVLDAGRGEVVLAVYSLEADRARLVSGPERLSIEAARERAVKLDTVALPPDLLDAAGAADAAISPSRALAEAVARRPGPALSRLEGIYSRPSAAEEKRGAP
jgi:tRNA threonylcarbamoyl adenosine modification protein YeaZ